VETRTCGTNGGEEEKECKTKNARPQRLKKKVQPSEKRERRRQQITRGKQEKKNRTSGVKRGVEKKPKVCALPPAHSEMNGELNHSVPKRSGGGGGNGGVIGIAKRNSGLVRGRLFFKYTIAKKKKKKKKTQEMREGNE